MPPSDPRPPVRALDRAPAGPDGRMFAPSAARNGEELWPLLGRVFPASGTILEIGSGTGQHAAFFAARLPGVTWLPTDVDEGAFGSIAAWCQEAGVENVAAPIRLDVTDTDTRPPACDGMLAVNVLHIAPEAAISGLCRVAALALRPQARLVLYGPFLFDDRPSAPSNVDFDHRLRELDGRFGVRRTAEIGAAAEAAGLAILEIVAMPKNNVAFVIAPTRQASSEP